MSWLSSCSARFRALPAYSSVFSIAGYALQARVGREARVRHFLVAYSHTTTPLLSPPPPYYRTHRRMPSISISGAGPIRSKSYCLAVCMS